MRLKLFNLNFQNWQLQRGLKQLPQIIPADNWKTGVKLELPRAKKRKQRYYQQAIL